MDTSWQNILLHIEHIWGISGLLSCMNIFRLFKVLNICTLKVVFGQLSSFIFRLNNCSGWIFYLFRRVRFFYMNLYFFRRSIYTLCSSIYFASVRLKVGFSWKLPYTFYFSVVNFFENCIPMSIILLLHLESRVSIRSGCSLHIAYVVKLPHLRFVDRVVLAGSGAWAYS